MWVVIVVIVVIVVSNRFYYVFVKDENWERWFSDRGRPCGECRMATSV
jgi:hypothetical protein|eukprot:SAG25_NODE_668_length_6042_cov_5.337540_4_plen_48_part_00